MYFLIRPSFSFPGIDDIGTDIGDVISKKFDIIFRSESRSVRSNHRTCFYESISNEHKKKCRNPCAGIKETKTYSSRFMHN